VLGVHDHHRTVAALAEAARLVHPDAPSQAAAGHLLLQEAVDFAGSVEGTVFSVRAHKDVADVLSQRRLQIGATRYHTVLPETMERWTGTKRRDRLVREREDERS